MKIKLMCAAICCASISSLDAQSFTEDKKGNSAIQIPVGNISINSEGSLTFNYTYGYPGITDFVRSTSTADPFSQSKLNEFDSLFVKSPCINRFMYGVSASGESANGLQALFSDGNFVAGSKIQGLFGVKLNFYEENIYKAARQIHNRIEFSEKLDIIRINSKTKLKIEVSSYLKTKKDSLLAKIKPVSEADTATKKLIAAQFQKIIDNPENDLRISAALTAIENLINSPQNTILSAAKNDTLFGSLKALRKSVLVQIAVARNASKSLDSMLTLTNDFKLRLLETYLNNKAKEKLLTFYVSADRQYREFKMLKSTNVNSGDLYQDMTFDGFQIKLGSNFYWKKNNILGLTIGSQMTDNYDSLVDFKHESTTLLYSDSTKKYVKNKTITGKTGNYRTFQQFPIMLDYLHLIKTDQDVIGINPYLRYYVMKKNEIGLKNNYTIGTGIYYFKKEKSAFVFGIYGEYNSVKKQGDVRPWQQRLGLGIVAKLNLTPLNLDKY